MFLFNNSQDSKNKKLLSSLGGSESAAKKFSFYELLIGEEDPNAMTGLLMVLVALLHVWGVMWMLEPVETMTLAEPMMMEVSMLNAPSPKPVIAPPKPPEPKKIPPKKVEKKKEPVLPKPLPMAENAIPTPSAQPQPVVDSRPTENKAPVPETYTEANFKANYGINPKPVYPQLAMSRGWEGKVLLRVSVSAEGAPLSVSLHQTSGHDSLDDAAIEAVEKWKFIPAKKGDKAVPSYVIVPINWVLTQN